MYWNTVSEPLREILLELSSNLSFEKFTLVGGTALSLQIGHRQSEDIDLFTDEIYGSVDMNSLAEILENKYPFYRANIAIPKTLGFSCYVGQIQENAVKLDLFYTDSFVYKVQHIDGVKLASLEEIIAMKLEVVAHGGRKKDFWDLHYFLERYSFEQLFQIYAKRYPYSCDSKSLKLKLIDFDLADADFEPKCHLNKSWELVKLDFLRKFGA